MAPGARSARKLIFSSGKTKRKYEFTINFECEVRIKKIKYLGVERRRCAPLSFTTLEKKINLRGGGRGASVFA